MAEQESPPVPIIQNTVSTSNLGCNLNLHSIALQARNTEYNPRRFSAVIMRIRDPMTTALVFASGKMVCTGAKSEELSRIAARKYGRIIQKLGFPVRFKDFKIQNIVASCDVGFPVRLNNFRLYHLVPDCTSLSYEPELFPSLIYRMQYLNIVLHIFASGKVNITGAQDMKDTYTAFKKICNLEPFSS